VAIALWGKVYYQDHFAGILRREPGGRCAFIYDGDYVGAGGPAIAHTLPLEEAPHTTEDRLPPFFDNLVAEGWLRNAQARALGVNPDDRFALLLAFGRDCAGAVSVIDPEPKGALGLNATDQEGAAALMARASLSGIQPKLTVVRTAQGFRPARATEFGSHIAKLPSGELPDIIELEWLTAQATRKLLPEEQVAEMEVAALGNIAGEALFVRRFDRTPEGGKVHFEEFNQLLGKPSFAKYDGSYEDMARFIRETPACIPAEAERLFRRVLTRFLTGDTDAHLKNFAMLHTSQGLRLAPSYDLVACSFYRQFDTIALAVAGAADLRIGTLRPKHIVALGEGYGLSPAVIHLAVADLAKRLDAAKTAIAESGAGHPGLRDGIIDIMEKRWNGTFVSIGQFLSKKRGGGEKSSGLLSKG